MIQDERYLVIKKGVELLESIPTNIEKCYIRNHYQCPLIQLYDLLETPL